MVRVANVQIVSRNSRCKIFIISNLAYLLVEKLNKPAVSDARASNSMNCSSIHGTVLSISVQLRNLSACISQDGLVFPVLRKSHH